MSDSMGPRGETTIVLGGKERTLRASFRTYAAIEQKLGPMTEVLQKLEALSIVSAATVLWAGCTEGGKREGPTLEEIGDLLVSEGMVEPTIKAAAFVGGPLRALARLTKESTPEGEQKRDE